MLVGVGEQADELLDAFEAGGGFLDCVGFHFPGSGSGSGDTVVGLGLRLRLRVHELDGHIYKPIKDLGS